MHSLFLKADSITGDVIGAAIEVHRLKGAGLIESIYEKCICRELELRGRKFLNQRTVKIEYKGFVFEKAPRFDLLIEDCVLLELKSIETMLPIHKAQLLSYMKLLDSRRTIDQFSRAQTRRWSSSNDAVRSQRMTFSVLSVSSCKK